MIFDLEYWIDYILFGKKEAMTNRALRNLSKWVKKEEAKLG